MDDLLSAALCEAGLEEFLMPSPVPSNSGSNHADVFFAVPGQSASTSSTPVGSFGAATDFANADSDISEYFNQQPTCSSSADAQPTTSGDQTWDDAEQQQQQGQGDEQPAASDVGGVAQNGDETTSRSSDTRLHVQVHNTSRTPEMANSCSPSPATSQPPSVRPFLAANGVNTPTRSLTASPASTVSSSGVANAAAVAATSVATTSSAAANTGAGLGPIIKRTIHTRNGIQTQYLKPFLNDDGQKIYRPLRTIPSTVAGRGGTIVRAADGSNSERVVFVRKDSSNGPWVYRQAAQGPANPATATTSTSGGTRMVTLAQPPPHHVVRSAAGADFVGQQAVRRPQMARGGNLVVRQGQRGTYAANGYRMPQLMGGRGGATMSHGRLLTNRNMAQRNGMPQMRYVTRGGGPTTAAAQRQFIHVSQSSPNFQYMQQQQGQGQMEYVLDQGPQSQQQLGPIVVSRHQQAASQAQAYNQNHGMQRSASVKSTGMVRMAQAGLGQSAGAFDNIDINRTMRPTGTNALTPATLSRTAGLPPMQGATSKSQKAKDEMKLAMQMATNEQQAQRRQDLDEDEENLGYAETYSEYTPAKLRSGVAHPDSVVESASLSSVSPPDVRYNLSIPEYLVDLGHISALQMEAVIYACQMHERRMPSGERYGYLIGDGAGVGKGRTVACIIFENYMQGRKRAIWLSVSSDLKFDSERDLRDVGAPNIGVYSLNKLKYAKISSKENGNIKKGVIFATYTSLIGECRASKSRKYRSRIKQLIQWFGVDYDGVIILDECHRAKNLVPSAGAKPTKTGRIVLELQKALPNARVVYASATGATEPRNMAYMTRLGLWGEGQAFPEFSDFIGAVERRGVGAMEVVAMDMKQRGLYLARQLSFRGVSFRVQEVQLSADFTKMYDEAVKLWMECRRQFQAVIDAVDEEERGSCKQIWGQFWACHQRFFKYLCIAAKVEECVRLSREAIKAKKCVVIGLQSTGESATLETLEELGGELNEFVSTAKTVLYGLIDKHFPTEASLERDIFKDFDRMYDEFDRPIKKKKFASTGLSFMDDLGFGSWSGATVGMSGTAGNNAKRKRRDGADSDANSTTSESSGDGSGNEDDDVKSWDSAREEAESGRTMDQIEEDEWVKALLAEAESSSDSEDNNDDDDGDDDKEKRKKRANEEAKVDDDVEEEFNPFMCDFTNNDPWANKQQIVDDTSPTKKKTSKKRKRVEDVEETDEQRDRKQQRQERRDKKMRRALRKAEREKQRRADVAKEKGTANDFITSSRICGDDDDRKNINPMMIKTELLAAVERLGPQLPPNTLDQLIDELGGPEYVAEMTGRRGHLITTEAGDVTYERRNANAEVSLELINMEEKDKFMRGDKLIAIISEAASSGISLQSDKRAMNQRRRVHITLELPWSADKAIQQFGRTHRSNQVSAPEYVFLISELAGEKRFASVVAKRLESLGALTHGDRRATETRDLSQFNMDNKYGRAALDLLLRTVIGTTQPPLIAPPTDYVQGEFFEDMRLYMEGVGLLAKNRTTQQYVVEKEAATIPKFLNRILGLPVHAQNALFHYFSEIVAELIAQSKHDGTYDTGIMDLGTGGDQVRKLETRVFLGRADCGSFRVEMHKIGVERGVAWDDAYALYKEHNTDDDGFYTCTPGINGNGKKVAALVYGVGKIRMDNGARLFAITRPSTGRSPKLVTMAELSKKFVKVTPDEARECWQLQFDGASKMCQHNYVYGKCKTETSGVYCEVGRRTRTYFVLSGSVLSVWPVVEDVLAGTDRKASRMQVIRVRTEQDQKIVGLLVLPNHVRHLVAQLETRCGRSIVKSNE